MKVENVLNPHECIAIDGHAHLHNEVSILQFIESARSNFRKLFPADLPSGSLKAALFLADFPRAEGFSRIVSNIKNQCFATWSIHNTQECCSLKLIADNGDRIWVIAGHQITTLEGIEMLFLGVKDRPLSGQSLREMLQNSPGKDALTVLPWGAGKWMGKRGKLILSAIKNFSPLINLGDSGLRPRFLKSKIINSAQDNKLMVIPGSDPLPLHNDRLRNGTFGLIIPGIVDEQKPSGWILHNLRSQENACFGFSLNFFAFLQRQLMYRING